MPTLSARLFASLREQLGRKTVEVDVAVENVDALITWLASRYQPGFKETLIDVATGQVRRGYAILVNGREIEYLNGLKTKLKDGDVVAFFPPIGGG